jgi:hypothetical protein
MEQIRELGEVLERANTLRKRCLARVLLSGILTLHVAPAAFFPPVPVLSAQVLLLIFSLVFAGALVRWRQLRLALAGMEFSGWAFDNEVQMLPRPIRSLDEHRPLPGWLVPEGHAPAPGPLAAAADDAVREYESLVQRRSECVAAHGCVTVYDAVNLIFAARGLARAEGPQRLQP